MNLFTAASTYYICNYWDKEINDMSNGCSSTKFYQQSALTIKISNLKKN